MAIEPSLFARFWEYGSAVIGYWQFWVAVAFMTERGLERYAPPNIWRKVDPHLTPPLRRTIFIWIAVIAFLYANFRAYDEVNARLRNKNDELIEVLKNKAESDRTNAVSANIQSAIGKAISDGEELVKDWQKKDVKNFEDEAKTWVTKTNDLITEAYGTGEAALFRSDAGYTFYTNETRLNEIKNWVDGRLRRLNELLPRSDFIPVQKGFEID